MNNIHPMNRTPRHIILMAFLLLMGSTVLAQSDSQYVIKVRQSDHYLAHVKNGSVYEIQDKAEFTPECLWYSGIEQNITGTNHNYYFVDEDGKYRYLSAPMQKNRSLGLSDDLPPTYLLSNTDTIYYFYDWDTESGNDGGGVARGHQYTAIGNQTECVNCGHSWGDGQCWDVYWVVYNGGWKTSDDTYYDIDDLPVGQGGGRYHKVSVVEHAKVINNVTGGGMTGSAWTAWNPDAVGNKSYGVSVNAFSYSYTPAYNTYAFREMKADSTFNNHTYHFSGNTPVATPPPASQTASGIAPKSFSWTITGDAAQFLSFESSGTPVHSVSGNITGSSLSQNVYYNTLNQTGTKTATLKLVVTYDDGSTQERSTTITLTTSCQNPPQAVAPVVNYDDVTVSWYNIADSYKVYWRKAKDIYTWNEAAVGSSEGEIATHTFIGLQSDTTYQYKVQACCSGTWQDVPTGYYTFQTRQQHELLVYGSVFGGGRMANVTGNTVIEIVNCDSIGAVYGGNDIAGSVGGANGSTITLGTAATEANIRIGSVYGGGNGYYSYGSTTFEPIAANAPTATVGSGSSIYALSESNEWNHSVWDNPAGHDSILTVPSIIKTAITVANDYVKVDSIFGGAKNAFLTLDNAAQNGSSVTINGGTIMAVFGGNNVGGSQKAGKQHVEVTQTKVQLEDSIYNAANAGFGRDFGIRYLFGGGNKVKASTTEVIINGGQMDTIFAGGNSADVATAANITVNCELGAKSGDYTFGKVYTNAFDPSHYTTGTIGENTIKPDYQWNGIGGIYNVRALFGGNNQDTMRTVVPTITLTSGSIGTVYGGGNAGDMNAEVTTSGIASDFGALVIQDVTYDIYHSTHVVLNSANVLVDYLYGGCQMSNVYRSAWVEIGNGHVGTVYGGCNISGDVGSRYLFSDGWNFRPRHERYQAVKGATYVKVSGGHIYKDLFAGSNGRYHCNNGRNYVAGIDFDNLDTEGRYIGMSVPSHNETHVFVSGGEVEGSVYAGGNLACVGFINESVPAAFYTPVFVGMATVRMTGGTVQGNVFGGGNMASIWGSNAVAVEGGVIGGALYGGNDRIGLVAQITNRVLPSSYDFASDGHTPLADVRTYISLTGRPDVNTVYGGGNGDYDYSTGEYCNPNDQPVQSNTFVDINIDGFADGATPGGHIGTVYGGGNGVTVTGTTTVFLNVKGENGGDPANYDHVDTIFGGNNKGPLAILPDIYLVKGHVNTVYGGCNAGAMVGGFNVEGYSNVGSRVILRNTYTPVEGGASYPLSGVVTNAVYGGCRMNGVTNNTLVLVEGGTYGDTVNFFGGSDISGTIDGTSHVVVTGGTVGNVYGGGNGGYYYSGNKVYDINDHTKLIDTIASGTITAPDCATSLVEILGGQVGTDASHTSSIFGGGLGAGTSTTGNVDVIIGTDTATAVAYTPLIYGDIYGGSALGTVNTNSSDTTTLDILNGTIIGDIYGGGLGRKGSTEPAVDPVEAKNFGKVYVNIGKSDSYNCFLDLRETNVFGCNNANGSPQDSVTVNVYKTAHSYTTYPDGVSAANYSANYTGNNPQYSIRQVFGGGNEADYAPEAGLTSSTRLTTVNVFTCDNTIGRTFGGGNAATVHKAASYIYGGRFHQVFGGGNGTADIPANIGSGGASLNVYNGNILQLFGGNNLNGEITGPMSVNVTNDGTCNENIVEFFGGSNKAVMGSITPVNLVTTIDCGAEPVRISTVYGGSNLAAIEGDVTLNIKGGEYTNVFGGSKGEVGTAANIDGAVTLNLFGGSIQQAFGGSNINGNITGKITVNVLDTVASCGLRLDTVYGSGNLTAYTPEPSIVSPEVNILKGTVNKVVFGGGKGTTAVVTANPKVTIGDNTHPAYITKVYGEVFGGGNAAPVSGNTTVICQANHATDTIYSLFGGGNEAGVSGNATVTMTNGKITQGIYGGCNANDTVKGNIIVNITGGTLGIKGSPMTQGIFGGGFGQSTRTTGNVTLTINKPSTDTIFADVYGGSALGHVAANTDAVVKLAKVDFQSGTINGTLFGGGMGDNTYAAEVTGNAQLAIAGNVTNGVYGGCNVNGVVKGDAVVGITNGNIGLDSNLNRGIVYGGGLGENTVVNGNVAVTVNNASGHIYGDVYGGSAKGVVNCTWDTDQYVHTSDDTTGVTFTAGTIHGNLYGGGHGIDSHEADVYGDVTVTVNGGSVNNVFGCNNLKGQPKNQVMVVIDEASPNTMSIDSVFGGGNQAYCESTPIVWMKKGTINYKVFGGGNNIADENKGVGGTDVRMEDGNVLGGIYGGCNTDGDVTGDVLVRLTGGTVGASDARASIHGGGYGQNTSVKGNVTVTFGDIHASDAVYPMLYGDLYGGSALGTVNDEASDLTTVNLYSGTITGIGDEPDDYGNVFGGGLGNSTMPAKVYGEIHVNIGSEAGGKATLNHCNVYGCNNVNGSPQSDVYLDLYQTAHTEKDEAGYFEADRAYAIYQVFGGGNRAHYAPDNDDPTSSKRTHVTIHECENTVNYVYGGGNAANAVGVVTIIQGGRFNEVYGGGNGRVTAANIGLGGIGLNVIAGNVSFLFRGSNKNGDNNGPDYEPAAISSCLGGLFVDSYFFGTNEAELYYDLDHIITCAEAGDFEYRYVYAGSRWGIVYGDISLTVCGGTIENLFGGCRGYNDYSADVRRFPTYDEITADTVAHPNPKDRKYSKELLAYMGYPAGPQPSFAGHGGNINLIINGGTIGKVFGGCDVKGNVEGQISITVNDAESSSCPLFIGEVYGASNQWHYQPMDANLNSPEVEIIRGTIGGSHNDLPVYNVSGSAPTEYEGNVFGGGNFGNVTSNPVVIVGDGPSAKVTIKGNVFGGGNEGDVTGGPRVIIVPKTHTLSITAATGGNIVRVTNTVGEEVSSGTSVGEGIGLNLMAIPSTNYTFDHWSVTTGTATIANLNSASTSFIMGTTDCTIEAVFASATPYTLNFSVDPAAGGTMVVMDAQGDTLSSGASIGQGSVLTLSATPNTSYRFKEWRVNDVPNINPATTTYTMGAGTTTIQAVFEAVPTHTFTLTPPEHGTVVIKDVHGTIVTSPASIGEGAVLSVTATPAADYALGGWSVLGAGAIDNAVATEISFTMGKDDATLSASFVNTHSFSITEPENGSIKITDALGYTVNSGASIGEGAVLNLRATPVAGYAFKEWQLTSGDGVIANSNAPITSLTMGTNDAVIKAVFVPAHTLTITSPENGSIKVTNILNQSVASPASIGEGAELTIVATPAEGHTFKRWEVTTEDGTVTYSEATETITMTKDTTITAIFE